MHAETIQGPNFIEIARLERPSYEVFRRDYETPLKPVVITGALSGWKAMSEWNHEWFKNTYGAQEINLTVNKPVA